MSYPVKTHLIESNENRWLKNKIEKKMKITIHTKILLSAYFFSLSTFKREMMTVIYLTDSVERMLRFLLV